VLRRAEGRFWKPINFRVRKVNRSIVTSPKLLAKPLKRQVDWPVNVAFTGSNLCTRANQLSPLNISTARAEDWPVNAVIQAQLHAAARDGTHRNKKTRKG
jgi:hypothetical protein